RRTHPSVGCWKDGLGPSGSGPGHELGVASLAFSECGTVLASTGSRWAPPARSPFDISKTPGEVCLWDLDGFQLRKRIALEREIDHLAVLADPPRVVMGGPGILAVTRIPARERSAVKPRSREYLEAVAISPDGERFVW